jgi:hypothetical protein
MAVARREIPEGHFVVAAHSSVQFMDCADEPVRRKPACDGITFQKGAIDFFRFGGNDAMKTDRMGHVALLLADLKIGV